ncbi:MAG TPA: hypothetical protein DDW27_03015 [Bacteroidales bacterium]|nr:hypothetical protein [Bacteroidales bacterium]
MNRILVILIILIGTGCSNGNSKRIPLAKAGNSILYLDQVPGIVPPGTPDADSTALIKNYINKWARRELMYQKAENNLSTQLMKDIDNQVRDSRINLVIYQYQRQMMLEKMDTTIADTELENYYTNNKESFVLNTNIVKALFIKLPVETPGLGRIRNLARSNNQASLQQLESLCYQFAEKFDDFNEEWVSLNQLLTELPSEINNKENFLRNTTFYETTNADSTYIYLMTIRDYRLRSSIAPFEYVKDDIKRIIWNNRRIEFIQSLENGIYNDALKQNIFTILNK